MPVDFRSGRPRPRYDPPPRLPPPPAKPRVPAFELQLGPPTHSERVLGATSGARIAKTRPGPGPGIENAKSVEPPEIQNLLRLLEASSRPFHVKQNERAAATPSGRTSSLLEQSMHTAGCLGGTCGATRVGIRISRVKVARWVPHRDALLPISAGIASGTTRACHPR